MAEEMASGVWFVHTGAYFPWRHFTFIPLFPTAYLVFEWSAQLLSGAMIFLGCKRYLGVQIASLITMIGLTQQFSNHRVLIFILLFYLLITRTKEALAFRMIRYQLFIVYLFSALNKINMKFLSGESLVALGQNIHGALLPDALVRSVLSPPFAEPLSWLVVGVEVAIPLVLSRFPKVGLGLVMSMHLVFSFMMPALWSFSLTMTAMAVLFLDAKESAAS